MLGGGAGAATGGLFQPFVNVINYKTAEGFPTSIADINTLVRMRIRGEITDEIFIRDMRRNGFNEFRARQIQQSQTVLLDINEIITLFRRGALASANESNEVSFFRKMSQLGVGQAIARQLIDATEVIANPQQLITFLVREVFNDEVRERFGYDQDFPDDLPGNETPVLPEFSKLGIGEELARNIWAAHWQLPAINQMFTALHRYSPDVIDQAKDDLDFLGLTPEQVQTDNSTIDDFLKVADYPAYFRPRLRAISYSPLTRVDTRRMIRLRLLTFNQVNYEYRKQGYTPRDARRLTKFGYVYERLPDWKAAVSNGTLTVDDILTDAQSWNITQSGTDETERGENQQIITEIRRQLETDITAGVSEERSLTKSEIVSSLRYGAIDRSQALEYLQDLNYSEEQAQFIISAQEARFGEFEAAAEQGRGLTKTEIRQLFENGIITKSQAVGRLVDIGYNETAATEIIELAEFKLNRKEGE